MLGFGKKDAQPEAKPKTMDELVKNFTSDATAIANRQSSIIEAEEKKIRDAEAKRDAAAAEKGKAELFTKNIAALTEAPVVTESSDDSDK